MPLTYFHNLVKLTDHLKEILLANCQVLDASYAAGKMCTVDLLAKQGHVTQLWHLKTSWIDVMDGVSLIEGLQMVFKDIVNTSLLTLISIVISVSLATTITRGTL